MELNPGLDATPFPARPTMDRATGRLIGSRCRKCGSVSWPMRPVCQRCGSADSEERQLSDRGTLITYTKVWVPRPGLETPYILGQVDLEDGVRVFAHGHGMSEQTVPLAVRLVLAELDGSVPPFFFEPTEGADD
jgi:uncharacterized OB-fold protein